MCVCSLTVPEVISLETSSPGWEHHVVRARGSGGYSLSWPFPVSRAAWLAILGSRPHPLQRQPHSYLQSLAALLSRAFLLFCVVRSPFASLLKQWWHWGLTQTIPISRSLLTSAKCTLWCKVTFMRIGIRLTFEALYSLYRLGYNVPSAQCQALLGGWVGPYENKSVSSFLD